MKQGNQYQTSVVLWAAILASQLIFAGLTFFLKPELFEFRFDQHPAAPSITLIIAFAAVAIACIALSFAFKKRFFERAAVEQNAAHILSGHIIALAFSEASSLIGFCLAFAFDYQYFFIWFIVGIAATILHFPKQSQHH